MYTPSTKLTSSRGSQGVQNVGEETDDRDGFRWGKREGKMVNKEK